jgi:threonine dehydratase
MTAIPTIQDIYAARPIVYQHLIPTPLHYYATLSELLEAQIYIKHENHQPVGAFKVRGGLVMATRLPAEKRQGGLYTASTGNHGQSISYGAHSIGIKATIAVPEGANPGKVASMRALGAEVVFHGRDFDSAREWIMEVANSKGGTFVGPSDDPLIHGVGTYALEILQDLPDTDVIIVPVGSGSGVSATSIVAKSINPKIEMIGVQSAQAPAAQLSWKSGKPVSAKMETFAEGIATRVPFENSQRIMRKYLDDFLLVDDDDIKKAIRLLLEHTHNLAEGAGAAPLAAAMQIRERLAGKKVVLVMSGGNLSLENLKAILNEL